MADKRGEGRRLWLLSALKHRLINKPVILSFRVFQACLVTVFITQASADKFCATYPDVNNINLNVGLNAASPRGLMFTVQQRLAFIA
tara:strand:+ start:95352 stop:95612 length:261 start_codon:yes stop_codon:yes gene_type:complete